MCFDTCCVTAQNKEMNILYMGKIKKTEKLKMNKMSYPSLWRTFPGSDSTGSNGEKLIKTKIMQGCAEVLKRFSRRGTDN